MPRQRKRNVAAGFIDEDGYFHPIRASYDYSAKRAGEVKRRKKNTNPPKKILTAAQLSRGIRAKFVKLTRRNGKLKVTIKR